MARILAWRIQCSNFGRSFGSRKFEGAERGREGGGRLEVKREKGGKERKKHKANRGFQERIRGVLENGKSFRPLKRKRPPAHSKIGEPFSFLRILRPPECC
jgi:hypothetical protein